MGYLRLVLILGLVFCCVGELDPYFLISSVASSAVSSEVSSSLAGFTSLASTTTTELGTTLELGTTSTTEITVNTEPSTTELGTTLESTTSTTIPITEKAVTFLEDNKLIIGLLVGSYIFAVVVLGL